jgi:sulfate/thiosulfate transport system permease protein
MTNKTRDIEVLSLWHEKLKRRHLGQWLITMFVLLWFALLILFPLYGIIKETAKNGLAVFIDSLNNPTSLRAFLLTLLITVVAVTLNTILGTIMALVFAQQHFKGKLLLESLVDLPFAVSPVVAGFMLILLFGPHGWLGSWFESMNIKIIYALSGMMLATLFVTLPFVAREILPILCEFGKE